MIINDEDNCYIKAYDIDNFVKVTQNKQNLQDMRTYKDEIVTKMKKKFG